MKYVVISVFDKAANGFARPIFCAAIGQAVRSFQDEVNNPQSEIAKHPGDYDMFDLGVWDDETGKFAMHEQPKLLARAINMKIPGEVPQMRAVN